MSKDSDDRNLFDGFGGSPPPAQKPGGRKVQPAAATNQTAQVPDARQMKLAGLSKSVADQYPTHTYGSKDPNAGFESLAGRVVDTRA